MQFSELCEAYEKISKTSKRLEKTAILAELITKTSDDSMQEVMMLLKGRVYPEWDKTQIGISSKLATKAIAIATGESEDKITKAFKKSGDLGMTAKELLKNKKQHTLFAKDDLTVHQVIVDMRKLSHIEGAGSVDLKTKTIANLLTTATPTEAHYLIRILLEDLRVGIADGTIRDAIVLFNIDSQENIATARDNNNDLWALKDAKESLDKELASEKNLLAIHKHYQKLLKEESSENATDKKFENSKMIICCWQRAIQDAIDKSNDIAKVAITAKHKGIEGLEAIELVVGTPIKVMLAQKEIEIAAAFAKVGLPAALEYKYDGFRMQVHKDNAGKVSIYTRRLENVTAQFPDVVARMEKIIHKSCILDAEAVGYDAKTGKYTPFQAVSQRIRRKYDIEQLSKELPVELNVFDILYYDNEQTYLWPFTKRRELLEKIVPKHSKEIQPSILIETSDEKEAEKFYKESLAAGNEGIMFKSLDAPYKPGSRVGFMIKMKPVLDTFDVVIVGAEWGEGKRSGWLTSFTVAVADEDGSFVEIGKVGTGLKELEQEGGTTFEHLTNLLKEDILEETGKEVRLRPNIVIELKFEEVQASQSYSSGFALRFPRFVQIRDDRRPDEISTIQEVIEAFEAQRGRNK